MYSDDRDFRQKMRFQKILWMMGNWTRINIPVVVYEDDSGRGRLKKHELTDIDVYGESIQPDFSLIKSIGDCKSGRNVKLYERMFWVKGIKEYLGAGQAYLVKKNIYEKAKLSMPKIGISGVDDAALEQMENIFHSRHLGLFSEEYYRAREEAITRTGQMAEEYKKIYDYLNTRYWFTSLDVSMKVLMTMLKKRDFYSEFTPDDKIHAFLLMEICIMFSRTLMDCCRYVLARDLLDVGKSVMEYINGGIDGYNSKMQMVRDVNEQVRGILGHGEDADFVPAVPDYYDGIVKMAGMLLGEAVHVKDVTRYLEAMQHEILLGELVDYTSVAGLQYSPVCHKLAKDIVVFYLKSNNIDIHFFDGIFLR